jgi:hypothetical protein
VSLVRNHSRAGIGLLFAVALPSSISTARAQAIRVLVREPVSQKPAAGAFVSLVGPSDETVASAIANELGRVTLAGPAGSLLLRVSRPGFIDTTYSVTIGALDSVIAVASGTRPTLAATLVATPSSCAAGGVPAPLASAWSEARKTLRIVAGGESLGAATLSVTSFDRELSVAQKVESQQINTLLVGTNRPPNVKPGAERSGYLESSADSVGWSAPDVETFASDEFERGHCFGWVAGTGEREGMAGLEFAPVDGSIITLAGTMWFDPPTRELRVIDYRFAHAPVTWRPDRLGGSIELHRSDPGLWITRFWFQRTPKIRRGAPPERSKDRLVGFHETGAEVTAVEPTVDTTDRAATRQAIIRQAALARGRFARMIGTVVDSSGQPIADAEVNVVGTELATQTNQQGHFVLSGLPTGLQITRIRKIGFRARFYPLRLVAGQDWEGKVIVARLPAMLAEIVVVGKYGKPPQYANTAKYDEFYRRRASRIGKFVTREEIDKQNSNRIADLIRGIPGVRTSFNPVAGNDAVEFDSCPADGVGVWVDGQRLSGVVGELLPLIAARDVETVEVYQRENQIPAEFQDGACAAIVLWTR